MEYIPGAPVNDEVKKANQNLPGMGGVFNVVNFHLYHYAGNNPVKYTDPDGRDIEEYQFFSLSAGLLGAIRVSGGLARDSEGKYTVYLKAEFGIGFGGDIFGANVDTIMKQFETIFGALNDAESLVELITGLSQPLPEDTGKGNFESIITYKGNAINRGEAGVLFGVNYDFSEGKNDVRPKLGVLMIANSYFTEQTVYVDMYSGTEFIKEQLLKFIGDLGQ